MTLPTTHQAYRDVTNDALVLNHKTQVCPSCRKARSVGQFDAGHKNCKQCRGVR